MGGRRRDDDRHEQEVEQPETIRALAAADRPQGDADDDQVESAFGSERKRLV
jgi:hypothetical protein